MKQIIFTIIIFILGTHIISLANTPPADIVVVLQESFSEKFPPDGWTLAKTNQNHTWESVGSAFDGHLKPEDGFWFAFVQGDSLMPSNELLITPPISVHDNCDFEDYNLDYYYYSTSILSIEFSQAAYPEWDIIYKEDNYPPYYEDKWINWTIHQSYLPSTVWIGFRFQDDQLSNSDAIALDYISFWCWKLEPEEDDDLDIDDDYYNDDQLDDDTGILRISQSNNSNNHGCECSMIYENTDVSLFLTLFLVGVGAWIVGNKRK